MQGANENHNYCPQLKLDSRSETADPNLEQAGAKPCLKLNYHILFITQNLTTVLPLCFEPAMTHGTPRYGLSLGQPKLRWKRCS